MHRAVKSQHLNEVKNRHDRNHNKIVLHSGQQQINGKCDNKRNEIHPGSYKRDLNLQANNIHNKNSPTASYMSNSFQNISANNERNSYGENLNTKYSSTFSAKKFITFKNYFQDVQNCKSINKAMLDTNKLCYKECENNQNQQKLVEEMSKKSLRSICHDSNQKTDEGSVECSTHLSENNETVMLNKDNEKEGNLGENVKYFVSSGPSETREKTPMCLVNDLARFNKIPFQYRLTSEYGPAHCKKFTVTLKLGDEEYTAEGFKIKKAQHLAAKEAMEKTKYKHPIPKAHRRSDNEDINLNLTPTVELNALAMKLGQQTYYILDTKQMLFSENNTNRESSKIFKSNYNVNQNLKSFDKSENCYAKIRQTTQTNKFNQLFTMRSSSPCKMTLIVGNQKFFGVGKTPQQAKHDAATNALQVLKKQIIRNKTETQIESANENHHKSPISLVFEIGIKRNLPVDFKVLREEGPAHMRTFTTACVVGNILTEGEGTGKKLSKKRAAQKMLEELKKLPPLSSDACANKRTKVKTTKKQVAPSMNSATDCKKVKRNIAETYSSKAVIKVLERNHNNIKKESVLKLISESENENSNRQQLELEISGGGLRNYKKEQKREVAANLLETLNRNIEVHSIKGESVGSMQSKYMSNETCKLMEPSKSNLSSDDKTNTGNTKETIAEKRRVNPAKESVDSANNEKDTTSTNLERTDLKSSNALMKKELLYLANLLGFKVDFSDYPKGNHNEFLTIVMLSTTPPQISHGVGINSEESQEDASRNALNILKKMGLDNVAKS